MVLGADAVIAPADLLHGAEAVMTIVAAAWATYKFSHADDHVRELRRFKATAHRKFGHHSQMIERVANAADAELDPEPPPGPDEIT